MQRAQHRRQRAKQGIPVVSLVGYTNAGKSTLMRALSGADVLVQDQLFATLDPVTRRVRLPLGGFALLTDTVGFIQKLPTQLVAAFRATLEELEEATLLLHVVDITHPEAEEQVHTVEETLKELGLADRPRVTALNKLDLLVDGGEDQGAGNQGNGWTPPAWAREGVPVSAAKGWGLEELRSRIEVALAEAAEAERFAQATLASFLRAPHHRQHLLVLLQRLPQQRQKLPLDLHVALERRRLRSARQRLHIVAAHRQVALAGHLARRRLRAAARCLAVLSRDPLVARARRASSRR